VDRIHLVKDRGKCSAVVNTVTKCRVSYTAVNLFTSSVGIGI
jgi:hypothetical protein